MPKYILNVSENWYRRYIVEAPTEEEVIATYLQYYRLDKGPVEAFGEPDFIDDGPEDTFFVEGEYVTSE